MRNTLEYPITLEEVQQALARLQGSEARKELLGDITPFILRTLMRNLDEETFPLLFPNEHFALETRV